MSRTKSPATVRIETMKRAISARLLVSPTQVESAILALYAKQTSDEQAGGDTRHNNAQGFTSADAKRMSFVAEFLKSGKHLTHEKALGTYGRKLQKYTGQLARMAIAKEDRDASARRNTSAGSERREATVCPRCNIVRCPDGCCCGC